ncbi:MAG TPA: RNA polymerase sigma factor FliA [Burkholderiaceae bacterium]|nr:RNA polymerase sigma factor FliA [Burkholderiaceae bacterium]
MLGSEDQLVARYAPLVRRLAMQMAARLPANVEFDDLTQAGLMGLLDAIRRYQSMPDAQFETYATTRIRGAMLDELRGQDWLPRSVRSKARTIEEAISRLNQTLMRAPTEAEIASELGIPLDEYRQMLDDAYGVQVVHYEDFGRRQDDEAGHPLDYMSSETEAQARPGPFGRMVAGDLRHALVQAIKNLPEREQLLLSLQFEQDLTQKEIAAVMEVSEGRISQIRSQAVIRLRAALTEAGWQEKPREAEYQTLI